jgi:ATP/maltotriose-dependent transcriptional regulator MalT
MWCRRSPRWRGHELRNLYCESLLYFRNMLARLDNRPLLGTIDAELFVAPPIMPQLEAAVDRALNVLILGPRGSGKTTLLRSLQVGRQNDPCPAVYVDLGPAQNEEQALMVIADALEQRWGAFGDQVRSRLVPETTPSGALLRLARRLGEADASLLLIDSPPGGGHAHVLFGRLRDELWQQGHQWVVATDETLRDELTRPPASAFFDVRLELDALSEEQQREFLARRLVSEPTSVDIESIVGKTDGLPRSILGLAREAVLSHRSVDALLAERERRRKRLQGLSPAASRIVAYLAEHGPTSGSDPDLLATLGVSGQRARMVLRQLEGKRLVRSFPEQQRHQGRPRKLYELRETLS